MELIPKQKIEESARIHSCIGNDIYPAWEKSFITGAQFAINEMTPLFCEFTDFCRKQYKVVQSSWTNNHYIKSPKTTKQLFDLWVENRNKE